MNPVKPLESLSFPRSNRRGNQGPPRRGSLLDEPLLLWRVIHTHRLAALLILLLVVAATAAFTFRQTPIYRASSTLRIEPAAAQVVKFDDVNAPVGQFNRLQYQQFYETQYQILRSRSIAQRATDLLRETHGASLFPGHPDPVGALMGATEIAPVPESQLVVIHIEHADPKLAALASQAIADGFIAFNLASRLETVTQASSFLDGQFEEWKQRKVESERVLLEYREKQDIFDLEDRQAIAVRRLTSATASLDDARSRRTAAESAYRKLSDLSKTPEGRNAMPALLELPAVEELLANQSRARIAYANAKTRYGQNHPLLQQAATDLASADSQVDQAVQRALDTAKARCELLKTEEEQRDKELVQAKLQVTELARRQVEMGVLQSEVQRNEKFFETLDNRRTETDISGLVRSNNVSVVDKALVPTQPVRPVWALNLVLAVVLGLVLGVATAFALDYLDNTVKSPDELEAFGLHPLAAIPSLVSGRVVPEPLDPGGRRLPEVFIDPKSPAAECYRVLRTNLRFASLSRPLHLLVVTSGSPRDGKSTTAANLAATIALGGQRVLLVDSDLRRPCLHKVFGVSNVVGLTSVFMGEKTVEEAAQETPIPGLFLLTSGPLPPNPAEVLASSALERLLIPAREAFDVVVCDSSPVLAVTDPVILASHADGVVFVVRHGQTTREVLRAAMRALQEVQDRVLGFVMNDLNTSVGYYPYHYVYYSSEEGEGGRDAGVIKAS